VCVRIAVTFALTGYHGGLTPPAPGCTHAYRRRFAVAIRKDVLFHTRSLRPRSCVVTRRFLGERRGAVTIAPWER
jgi:hypothetical protein